MHRVDNDLVRARVAAVLGAALSAVQAGGIVVGPPFGCTADCNGDGAVAINEMIVCINAALVLDTNVGDWVFEGLLSFPRP